MQRLNNGESVNQGDMPNVLAGATDVAVSPSGEYVIVSAVNEGTGGTLAVYQRTATTGGEGLKFHGSFDTTVFDSTSDNPITELVVDSDGYVYVSGPKGLQVFSGADSGSLVPASLTLASDVSNRTLSDIKFSTSDGKTLVYAAEPKSKQLHVLERTETALTLLKSIEMDVEPFGVEVSAKLEFTGDPAVPAGRFVYVSSPSNNTITVFDEFSTSGTPDTLVDGNLRVLQTVREGVSGIRGLQGVRELQLSLEIEDAVFSFGNNELDDQSQTIRLLNSHGLQTGQEVWFNRATPEYNFSSSSYSVTEGHTTNTTEVVSLHRNDSSVAEEVQITLSPGASNGATNEDFSGGIITVTFGVGETSKRVPIELLGDATVEPDETIDLSLTSFSRGNKAGTTHPTATLTITNDDSAGRLLTLSPDPTNYQPGEGQGYSVAATDAYRVVGAPYADTDGFQDSGVVRVYDSSNKLLHTLQNPSPGAGDLFGISVAVSGSYVVVGASSDDTGTTNAGSVYVYKLDSAKADEPFATFQNPGPEGGGFFGNSVAVSGNYVVVGANRDFTGANFSGRAYVYDLSLPQETRTMPRSALDNPTPKFDDSFGISVAVSGNYVVVGAIKDDAVGNDAGTAYVFDLSSPTPDKPIHTLTNPDPGPGIQDNFGNAVAVSGNYVVVAAHRNDLGGTTDAGSVYVYDLSKLDPAAPQTMATLDNPNPAGDLFGSVVAVSGSYLVVGAAQADKGDDTDVGSVYVYKLDSNANTAVLHATVNNPGPAANDFFGFSVAVAGDHMVVGAYRDDTRATNTGTLYIYELPANPGNLAVPIATLNDPTHDPNPATGDNFGRSVAAAGNYVVVGAALDDTVAANAGSVYVYDRSSTTPDVPIHILNNPSPAASDQFGWSVSVAGNYVAVGAYGDDVEGKNDAGSVYVYDLKSATPNFPIYTLNNPNPAVGDNFGWSVAMAGEYIVVGAYRDDHGDNTDAGSAYVYKLDPTNNKAELFATLENPTPAADDHFGVSLAVAGNYVVVGANQDDTEAPNAGSAYLYDMTLDATNRAQPIHTLSDPNPAAGDNFGISVAAAQLRRCGCQRR